jgi:hypothetical protein
MPHHYINCYLFLYKFVRCLRTGFADRTPFGTYVVEMTVNGDVSPTDGIPTVADLDQ